MGNTDNMFPRIFSGIMAFLLFACSYMAVPTEVLAAEAGKRAAVEAYNSVNSFSSAAVGYSALLGEEEGLRGEATRTFRRADGMSEAVVYAGAVAYETEDGYALIDNTLVKTEEGYGNRGNDLRVLFREDTEKEELVRMEAGGSLLSWYIGGFRLTGEAAEEITETPGPESGAAEEPAAREKATEEEASEEITETPAPETEAVEESVSEEESTEEGAPEEVTEAPGPEAGTAEETAEGQPEEETGESAPEGEAAAEPSVTETGEEETEPAEDTAEETEEEAVEGTAEELTRLHAEIKVTNHEPVKGLTGEEADMQLRFPAELTSEAEYADEGTGIKVRYILSGKSVTEEVTLAEYPGKGFYYVTVISWDGGVKENGDGTYLFVNSDGEESFLLGKPYMEDASGETGEDIETGLVSTGDGTYVYTVMPDEGWMEKAAYPVTIDPDFSADFSGSVTDTYVDPNAVTTKHGSSTTLASYVSGTMILLKIADEALPALASGDAVTYAALHMAKSNTDGSHYNTAVAGYRVTSDWDGDTTYSGRPSYDGSALTVDVSSKRYSYTEFDITGLVREWYADRTATGT